MKCRYWKRIQDHLDEDRDLTLLAEHLEKCSACSSRLELYLRVKNLYAAEVFEALPLRVTGSTPSPVKRSGGSRMHPVRWIAAAAVFCCAMVYPGMLLHSHVKNFDMQREFAREFAEQLIQDNTAEAAFTFDSGYSLTWFD